VDNLVAGSFDRTGKQLLNDNRISDEMAKFSYQLNQKNRLSLMYFRNQKNRYHRNNTGQLFVGPESTVLQNQPAYDLDLKWTFVPSSRWVFDVGAALTAGKTPYRYQNDANPNAIYVSDSSLSTAYNTAEQSSINPVYRVAIDAFASYFTSNATGNHNLKFGWQYSKDGYNQIFFLNGGIRGTIANGVPQTASLYNSPIREQKNNLLVNGLYAMDTWTIKRRLTVNLGIRFEQWKGSIPEQTSPAGPWTAARTYAALDGIIDWKSWTPRLGFSFDVFGNGKTVVKGSFNRYVQGEGMNLLTAVNPLALLSTTVPWKCSVADNTVCRDRGPLVSELTLPNPAAPYGGVNFSTVLPIFDKSTKRPYSFEESFGIQQQLPGSMIVSVIGWYRTTRDGLGRINNGQPASAYTAFNVTNPITGAPLTLYSAPQKTVDFHIVNSKLLDQWYRGLDVTVNRRFGKGIMLGGGLTYGRNNGASFGDVNSAGAGFDDLNNPNYNINRNGANFADQTVNFKLNGIYTLPFKVAVAANYQHSGGYPLQNRWAITPTTAGIAGVIPAGTVLGQNANPTVYLVPSGTFRLSDVDLLDLRFSREIRVKERFRFVPEFDIYNTFNSSTVTSVNQNFDATAVGGTGLRTFLNPAAVLFPRSVKFGVKFDF
jgi:hypothetical protein